MRWWYLTGIFLLGFAYGLVTSYRSDTPTLPTHILIGKALAPALIYLIVAAIFVRPWRNLKKYGPPSFVAPTIAVAVLVGLDMMGRYYAP